MSLFSRFVYRSGLLALLLVALVVPALAQGGDEAALTYQLPDQALVDLVDAPLAPFVRSSPDRRWLSRLERQPLPSIAELSETELRLAGLRLTPRTNGRSRRWYSESLTLHRVADGTVREVVGLPEGARIDSLRWAPDGRHAAFTVTGESGIALWVVEVASGEARQLFDDRLNAVLGTTFAWLADSRALIAATVPAERGEAPPEPKVPTGPVVQENLGRKAPARTYQDLLANPHDEALFEHYLKAQLVRVPLAGDPVALGSPGVVFDFDPSPDGRFVLVETLHRPFSYLVPYYRFPRQVDVWDLSNGKVRPLFDLPLHEEVPMAFGSVPTGPRDLAWRPDEAATLYWAEALDGGDAGIEAEERDRLFLLAEPFESEPRPFATLALRYDEVEWTQNGQAVVLERWWKNRRTRTWQVDPSRPEADPVLLWDRSWQDRYSDPGDFLTLPNRWGRELVATTENGRFVFLAGEGASPEGDRPFVDRLDLRTRESTRLWRSEAPFYEEAVELLDREGSRVLTHRESVDDPADYFVRDLPSGELTRVIDVPHPHPDLIGIQKELVRYERADGVKLMGTLYLPAGYSHEQGPLPMLMWAYPREYKSADDAGQVRDSPYQFNRIDWWSPLVWLTQGYAVLDDPSLPIVGEGDEEPNDSYVEQLVAGAEAAVEEMVRRGVADRDRIAIAGHSYGAFMAANLLSHSDLFRAGIARSGAYNRSLTPFGFQAEERTIWEAPEIYFAMSPFMHAEKVNEPLLLIHGDSDNNSGTFPLQSRRYYGALKGLGATVRLVMLPHESHGYRARASVLHTLWETERWLDRYVKEAPPRAEDTE